MSISKIYWGGVYPSTPNKDEWGMSSIRTYNRIFHDIIFEYGSRSNLFHNKYYSRTEVNLIFTGNIAFLNIIYI